ncbi:10715_t:CDS:2 [Cetraspora pellucida]|uniref:10715_t:CDS:1 n=1 Tax=Cetraspora pellucida TaxID=1433469 RepID=A0A9N8VYG4_9GLOM|nr:10715_t:CDS:2 [Cetraspora pellucida]
MEFLDQNIPIQVLGNFWKPPMKIPLELPGELQHNITILWQRVHLVTSLSSAIEEAEIGDFLVR